MTGQHPAVPHPNANYSGLPHDELKKLVTTNVNPGVAYKAGDEWKQLAGQLREAAITLDAAINGSQSHWEGAAADLARAHLAKVRDWSADTAEFFNATGTAMHDQVDAAAKAKADMPDPINFDPVKMFEQAASNPISMIALPAEMYLTYNASNDAKDKAVKVVQTRDASMQQASASIPAFTPPPDISDGGTTNTSVASAGPVGSGSGVAAYQGHSGGGSYGGGGSYNAGNSGYQPVHQGVGGGSGYTPNPVGGTTSGTRVAGYDPGTGGPGYNNPNYTNTTGGNSPYGPGGGGPGGIGGFGPGGAGGAGGGAGYRGGSASSAASSSSSAGRPGAGASTGAGGSAAEGAGARGGMGSAGAGGQSGMGGAGGRGGKKEEDKEHKRPTFLVETDDVFGDGQMVAPTVIGENPAGY
jgi:PPE family